MQCDTIVVLLRVMIKTRNRSLQWIFESCSMKFLQLVSRAEKIICCASNNGTDQSQEQEWWSAEMAERAFPKTKDGGCLTCLLPQKIITCLWSNSFRYSLADASSARIATKPFPICARLANQLWGARACVLCSLCSWYGGGFRLWWPAIHKFILHNKRSMEKCTVIFISLFSRPTLQLIDCWQTSSSWRSY